MNLYSEFMTIDHLIQPSRGHVRFVFHRFNSTYCLVFKCGVLLEPGRGLCLKATAWTTVLPGKEQQSPGILEESRCTERKSQYRN